MEQVEVVGGCYGQDVVHGMPHGMEDPSSILQRVNAHFIATLLWSRYDLLVAKNLAQLAHVTRCLVAVLHPWFTVENAEEVVVTASDQRTAMRSDTL